LNTEEVVLVAFPTELPLTYTEALYDGKTVIVFTTAVFKDLS